MNESVSIIRYCGVFALVYGGLLLFGNVLSSLFGFDLGSGLSAGILVVSAYGAAASFVQHQNRLPDKNERRKLAWGSLLASYIISSIALYTILSLAGHDSLLALKEILDKITPILFGVAFIIVTLLYYLVLGFCYLWFGKIAIKSVTRAERSF